MSNDTKVTVWEHHQRGALLWAGSLVTVIILGVVGYALYLVRQYIIIVGWIWLVSLMILPTLAVVFLVTWLVKYILHVEVIEIGPGGTLLRLFNRVTEYHPLAIKEHRTRVKELKEAFQVPLLLDLLKGGLLGLGDLLLGYHQDGTARWGMWDDLRTFAVAGKSRSGKTVTMVFFILQALLGGAIVYVCDPHHNKASGLLKVLEPVVPFLRVARTDNEIVAATCQFREQMLARKAGGPAGVPILIAYDEWSSLMRELDEESKALCINTVLGCAEEYAGFNGFAMVGGHEWTAQELGGKKGAAIRRGFHSVFVHKLEDDSAKFLLRGSAGKKAAMKAATLPRGHAFFKGADDDEIDYLIIPYYGKEKEAVYEVAEMLKQLPGPANFEKLSPGSKNTGPLSLEIMPSEAVNAMKQLQGPIDAVNVRESFTVDGETFTAEVNDPADALYTPEKEKQIILAAFEIVQSGQKATRTGIRDHLGWTNKQWNIIKAVCDKHRIAS